MNFGPNCEMQSVPATQLSIPLPPSSPYQHSSLLPHAKLCVHLSLWILQSRKPHKRIRVDSQVSFVLTPSQISTWLPKRIQPSVSPELQLKQLAASSWKLLLLVLTCRMKVWSHPHLVHGFTDVSWYPPVSSFWTCQNYIQIVRSDSEIPTCWS